MDYVQGVPDDEAEHARFCDMIVNGVSVAALSNERVVWKHGSNCILLVTDSSPEDYRKLAHDVSSCANRELHYDVGIYRYTDPPDERELHIFLYIRAERAVGMLLFEKRTTVWRCTWNGVERPNCISQPERGPMWSIGFVWVLTQYRHTGIAYRLFEKAKKELRLDRDDVGWYTPFSQDGEVFVRRSYPTYFFVAK